MPKVTVIMPSLNVVGYIRACLESVLSQTLRDLEVLVIDAGSDDGTLEVIQEYAGKDSRVRLLHSEKRSYGYQLNRGIASATGEYVGIVETDDRIFPDMYEALYSTAVNMEAEYVKGRAMQFFEFKPGVEWRNLAGTPLTDKSMLGKVVAPCDMPELLLRDIFLWNGIYERTFVRRFLLNETPGAAFQDQGFLFQTISACRRAVYLDQAVYQYRQDNSNSSIFNRKGFHYLVDEYAYIENFLESKNDIWKKIYYQRMWNQVLGRLRTMAASGTFWEEAEADIEILRERLLEAVDRQILKPADMDIGNSVLFQFFQKGVGDAYLHCKKEFEDKMVAAGNVLKATEGRQVIIFGSGRNGKFIHALIENRGSGVVAAYCDNNHDLWGTMIQGASIISPKEAVGRFEEPVYVIANRRNAGAMKGQLKDLGVRDRDICAYQEDISLLLFHRI